MKNEENGDPIRKFLQAMGHDEMHVEAALAALSGETASVPVAEEPLMSPKQLAKRLSISTVTLWRMQPPYIRVGQRKRFVWSEIQEFLKATGKKVAA